MTKVSEQGILLYCDILGYNVFPNEWEKFYDISSEAIRRELINLIKTKLDSLKKDKDIRIIRDLHQNDEFILFCKIEKESYYHLNALFKILKQLTAISLKIKPSRPKKIQFEIGLGLLSYDDIDSLDITSDKIADKLKSDLIVKYKSYYRDKISPSHRKPRRTFVVLEKGVADFFPNYERELIEIGEGKVNKFYILKPLLISYFYRKFTFGLEIGKYNLDILNINWLFVPPNQFKQIIKMYLGSKIIIISGSKGLGKTYIALRILWERFIKSEKIKYFYLSSTGTFRSIYEKIKDITTKCYYVFDNILDRNQNDLNLLNELVKSMKNLHIILILESNLNNNITTFRIILESYNYASRKKILLKHGKMNECIWYKINDFKQKLLNFYNNHNFDIVAPIYLNHFCTITKDMTDHQIVKNKLKQVYDDVQISVREEFNAMDKSTLILLYVIYILEICDLNTLKNIYDELGKTIGDIPRSNFWYNYNKIKENGIISNTEFGIEYTHVIYNDSIKEINFDDDNSIFNLIINIIKDDHPKTIPRVLTKHFYRIKEEIRNELLEIIEKQKLIDFDIFQLLDNHFDKINENYQTNILTLLLNSYDYIGAALYLLSKKYSTIPDKFKDLVKSSLSNIEFSQDVLLGIEKNFYFYNIEDRYQLTLLVFQNQSHILYFLPVVLNYICNPINLSENYERYYQLVLKTFKIEWPQRIQYYSIFIPYLNKVKPFLKDEFFSDLEIHSNELRTLTYIICNEEIEMKSLNRLQYFVKISNIEAIADLILVNIQNNFAIYKKRDEYIKHILNNISKFSNYREEASNLLKNL